MTNAYEVKGAVTELEVEYKGTKFVTLVDTEDIELIDALQGTWHIGWTGSTSYVFHSIYGRTIYLHRLVMSEFSGSGNHVDHISGDTLDNRKRNLEVVTPGENSRRMWQRKRMALQNTKLRRLIAA